MNKSTIKNAPNPTSSGSGEGKHDLIDRQAAIDAVDKRFDDVPMELTTEILQLRRDLRERIPSAQPATNCSEIPNGSDDTISRQAAIDALTHEWDGMVTSVFDVIKSLPSAQPERKRGKWIPSDIPWYRCSECGAERENTVFMEYFCPNCGADMRGGGE